LLRKELGSAPLFKPMPLYIGQPHAFRVLDVLLEIRRSCRALQYDLKISLCASTEFYGLHRQGRTAQPDCFNAADQIAVIGL
jgi:hypothetical protein